MNKKGFTLVELLAVITLLSILMAIAVPNVISTINNNKRNNFLTDATRMIAKAEYLMTSNKEHRNKLLNKEVDSIIYYLNSTKQIKSNTVTTLDSSNGLNEKQEFQKDTDGGSYKEETFVKISLVGSTYQYCICMAGSKRNISSSNNCLELNKCLTRDELIGISVVKDN